MGLQVVEPACTFDAELANGVVVIESDEVENFGLAIEELTHADAKRLARAYATTRGCTPCACKPDSTSAYPINAEGLGLEDVRDEQNNPLPATHPRMQVARYRIDVPVVRRMV